MFKQLTLAIALCGCVTLVSAQATDAVKESGKAVSEKTQEGVDNAKAATHSGPEKAVDKTKAKIHKAKSSYHKHKAKSDAESATH